MIKQKDRPVSNGRYRLITGDVTVANKRLTDKELDEIIKFSIDPSKVLKSDNDAERLADIGTKSVRVGDVVNMINQIINFHEESLDQELGLLEYIVENKLGLKKREIKKFAKEYQSKIDAEIEAAKEKVKESDNNLLVLVCDKVKPPFHQFYYIIKIV